MTPANNKQLPDHAILDRYNKQTYLGNSFIASTGALTIGTSETAILSIINPATNNHPMPTGLFSLNRRFYLSPITGTLSYGIINVYLNPTISSAGTVVTPVNLRPGNANTSLMSVHKSPTASANGTLLYSLSIGLNFVDDLLLAVDPGDSLLITANPAQASTPVYADISWYEL